jgi:predicted Zn-dependent protease
MGPDNGTGYAEHCAVDATTIDAAAIGREAAEKARATAEAVSVEPGDYPVVLEEYAVVDLLDMLGYLGFSATAVQEERSFFEPGKRIGTDLVTIVDDGYDPAGLPLWFDFEGVAKQRVSLVENGVCRNVVYDAQTAARDGVASTGHGLPAPNPYGPFPLNMIMAPGDESREELIGGLDRGLLVTRFHYTNPVHPKLAIVTGMTRDGTFLVEGGRIIGPVRNLRYTQSYLAALAGTVAVARDRRTLRGFLGGVVVPAVRIDGWTFTGGTEH